MLRWVIDPIYTTWLAQSIDPRVRATVISISGQADALGQVAGGPAIGAIGLARSLRAALVVAGAVLAPALLLYVRALGQGPTAVASEGIVPEGREAAAEGV